MGLALVLLRPGDTIPNECTIVRAFTCPERVDAHRLVLDADWLWETMGPQHHLNVTDMDAVWARYNEYLATSEPAP